VCEILASISYPGSARFQLERISAVTDPGPEHFRPNCTTD